MEDAIGLWTRLSKATDGLPTPRMVVDLDAFDANAASLVARAGGTPIRVASKSLRVPALISRALTNPGFAGILGYTLREAIWLVRNGISDDVLVAYPSVDAGALAELANEPDLAEAITIMIDSVDHLDITDTARSHTDLAVRVAIDIDSALRMPGVILGPRRSPLHDADSVERLATLVRARKGYRLVGAMSYEGQVAGVPDAVPGQRAKSLVIRGIKTASLVQLKARRMAMRKALGPIEFFNAGGSGSLESASADPSVTEVTAGSGLFTPTLFDHFRSFEPRPATWFGVPVTRKPEATMVTVHGGGLIASGPAGPDRVPTPVAPAGLAITGMEGTGEVQTPLTGEGVSMLEIGDVVWFRHAKSGELFEHTNTAHLIRGDRLIESVPTYRGRGLNT